MGEPNHAFRDTRERLPSRDAPGEPLSRAELADAVNAWLWRETGRRYALDDHAVGRWERGKVRWPNAPYRAALRFILGVASGGGLGFTRPGAGTGPRAGIGPEWTADAVTSAATEAVAVEVNRCDALRAAALGGAALLTPLAGWLEPITRDAFVSRSGAFSLAEVEALEHVADTFRQWRSAESGLGRTAVLGQLADVGRRLKSAASDPLTDRAVFVVAAELARVSASMAFDAGEHRPAQDHYMVAARLAKSGHDVVFGAVALSALARLQFDVDAADDGLNVVGIAQRGTRRTSSARLTSLLATREAWGYAQNGDTHRFLAAVDRALDTHGDAQQGEPAALRGFDVAELHGTVGARYRDMTRHDRRHAAKAAEHVTSALALRGPDRARNRAFDFVSLARVQLIAREPDSAAESARSALPYFDVRRPGRLGRKFGDFLRESAPYRTVPIMADVRDEIEQLTSTAKESVT